MKITKKQIYIISAIVVLIIAGIYFLSGSKSSTYNFIDVEKGNVIQEVSATGRVKSAKSVDLALEKSGRVTAINVEIGSLVNSGQSLIHLDNSELLAQLQSAEAVLKSQIARLDELKKGTRPEEIKLQETRVVNAQTAINNAKKNAVDAIGDAYIKSDDAIYNKVDQFFNNPRSSNPSLSFTIINLQLKNDMEWGRVMVEDILVKWKASLEKISVFGNVASDINEAQNNLNQINSFLNKTALVVNGLLANANLSQTTIDGWKGAIAAARNNVSAAIINITSAEQAIATSNSNLAVEENQLVIKKAGAVPEQITAQEALVDKAMADINVYKAQIAKSILYSPIKGMVTKQDAKLGEIAAANLSLISIIGDSLEIEVNVPEADIAKIKVGNIANIKLDAYGNDVNFGASIVSIDPAEKIIEGVATYRTVLQFNDADKRIMPGMTADVDIISASKENVLYVPQRAVASKNGKKIVMVRINDKEIEEREITAGLKGSDGNIEIISGLELGEKIVDRL